MRVTRRSKVFTCGAFWLALVGVGECQTDLVDDAGFQLWCGERLCVWDLEQGEIERVGTWHEHDYGVSFVSDDVRLSQRTARGGGTCITTTARIDRSAMVTVEIDVDGDGRIDWVQPIRPSPVYAYEIWDGPSVERDGVVYVRKVGPGRAVVARLRVFGHCSDYER